MSASTEPIIQLISYRTCCSSEVSSPGASCSNIISSEANDFAGGAWVCILNLKENHIKFRVTCSLAMIVSFSFALSVQAQDSHVRSEYMPKIKMTKVETDMLLVSNSVYADRLPRSVCKPTTRHTTEEHHRDNVFNFS